MRFAVWIAFHVVLSATVTQGPSVDVLVGALQDSEELRSSLHRYDWYEFGLLGGHGTNYSMHRLGQVKMAPHHLFGFDSFAGLPQGDSKFKPGQFSSKDLIEQRSGAHNLSTNEIIAVVRETINFPETTLIPGFYDESLQPELVAQHRMRPAFWVNMDADLYSSTITSFKWLFSNQLMRKGTFVYYDDTWYYPHNDGEVKAHSEISRLYGLQWRPRLELSREQLLKRNRTWWDPDTYDVPESEPYDFRKLVLSRKIWGGPSVGVLYELLTPGPYALTSVDPK